MSEAVVAATVEEAATDDLVEMLLLLLGALRCSEVDSGVDLGDIQSSSFDVRVRVLCGSGYRQGARANCGFQEQM